MMHTWKRPYKGVTAVLLYVDLHHYSSLIGPFVKELFPFLTKTTFVFHVFVSKIAFNY